MYSYTKNTRGRRKEDGGGGGGGEANNGRKGYIYHSKEKKYMNID